MIHGKKNKKDFRQTVYISTTRLSNLYNSAAGIITYNITEYFNFYYYFCV